MANRYTEDEDQQQWLRCEGKLAILSIWLCEITIFSLKMMVSEITYSGKMQDTVILGPVQ